MLAFDYGFLFYTTMINLFAILKRFYVQIMYILLMVLGFTITIQQKNYQNAKFVNSANAISGGAYSAFTDMGSYFGLKSKINDLALENANLRSQLPSSLKRVNGDYVQINDSLYHQKYVYRVANVISNSLNKQNNYITLDLGEKDGVIEEMGVISSKGVVGVVRAVSPNYSTVLSFLHPSSSVSCKIKSTGVKGYLEWNKESSITAEMRDVLITTKVSVGDTVITSGNSSLFPEGLFLGVITDVQDGEENQSQKISVKLNIQFDRLNKVYVVENLFKKEILELENGQSDFDEE